MAIPGDHQRILKSLCGCGAARQEPVTARRIARNGEDVSGHLSGVYRCHKRMCPVCAYRISIQRFRELLARAEHVQAAHPEAVHIVGAITCHHAEDSDPRQLFDAMAAMWDEWRKQDWVSGRRRKKQDGNLVQVLPRVLLGYIACPEDTFGFNGHHPHLQFMATLDIAGMPASRWADRKRHITAFGARTQRWFQANAHRWGLHCEWRDAWWQVLQSTKQAACWYLLKGGTEEVVRTAEMRDVIRSGAAEATMGARKKTRKGKTIWEMPGHAYVRLWLATRGMRWYRAGGVWRIPQTKRQAGQQQEQADTQDYVPTADDVAMIVPDLWRLLPRKAKAILAAVNEDMRYSRDDVALAWLAAVDSLRAGLRGKDLLAVLDAVIALSAPRT